MESISQKLVEDWKNIQEQINYDCEECKNHREIFGKGGCCDYHKPLLNFIMGKIKQHAETCEAILKHFEYSIQNEDNFDRELFEWLENEIKILKENKLI